jgi:hypothetical protein
MISFREKEVIAMAWPVILAIIIAVPVLLIAAVFVWYINVSGILTVMRETRRRAVARRKRAREAIAVEQTRST